MVIVVFGCFYNFFDYIVFGEFVLFDCLVDVDDILLDDMVGVNVEMVNFGVVYQFFREVDSEGGGIEFGEFGGVFGEFVYDGGFGGSNSIVIFGRFF